MKSLKSYISDNDVLVAKTYRIGDGEYMVRFWRDGMLQGDADYFTDDADDAEGTARHFVNGPALVELTYLEFVALVGPLLVRNIAFELALAGHFYARYTWNVGDKHIIAVRHDGQKIGLDLPCEN